MLLLNVWHRYMPEDYRNICELLGRPPEDNINFMDFSHLMHTLMHTYPFVPADPTVLDTLGHQVAFPMTCKRGTKVYASGGADGLPGLLNWLTKLLRAMSRREYGFSVEAILDEVKSAYAQRRICGGILAVRPHYDRISLEPRALRASNYVLVCVWMFDRWYGQMLTLSWRKEIFYYMASILGTRRAHCYINPPAKFITGTQYVHRIPRICAYMIIKRLRREEKPRRQSFVRSVVSAKVPPNPTMLHVVDPTMYSLRLSYMGDYPIWVVRRWNRWLVGLMHPLSSRLYNLCVMPYFVPPVKGLRVLLDELAAAPTQVFEQVLKLDMKDVEHFNRWFQEDPAGYANLVMAANL